MIGRHVNAKTSRAEPRYFKQIVKDIGHRTYDVIKRRRRVMKNGELLPTISD